MTRRHVSSPRATHCRATSQRSRASSLLQQTLTRAEVVNATFSAGPPPKSGGEWDDEMTKLVGPEIFRRDFASAVAVDSVLEWLTKWARDLLQPGSGLTTPISVIKVRGGVLLRFLKQRGGYADFDKPETKDDKWAASGSGPAGAPKGDGALLLVAEATASSTRVRVRRAEMGDGAVAKEMSEATVLEKLGRDLALLDKTRGR